MKAVIAIDSFKGSLSSMEAGKAAAEGIWRVDKDAKIAIRPLADGGEGTVEALTGGMNGEIQTVTVTGPLGEPVKCEYGIIENSHTAVIEMSGAAGITLVPAEKRNPLYTTTYGVGEVIKDAIAKGCRRFIVGIGGSATNDGGIGMLQALGYGFLDKDGNNVPFGARGLEVLDQITDQNVLPELSECEFKIACDVTNILCGENGASYIFGPQKGASLEDVKELDSILRNYGNIVDELSGGNYSSKPGSGAAGGLGYALLSVCQAEFKEGIVEIMNLICLEETLKDADLVITGEGRIDNQSVCGKAPVGIAKMAKKYNIPVIAVVGSSARNLEEIYKNGIDLVLDIINEPMDLDKAIKDVKELLEFTGEKAIRAFLIGNKF